MDPVATEAVLQRVAPKVRATFTPEVVGRWGLFGGMVRVPPLQTPVLVTSVDGVGTKTLLARRPEEFRILGHDAVAHGLNDVAVHGARPLVFLDYVAASRLQPEALEAVVEGVADACARYGVALVGGETAEMPGVYAEGAWDVVGCTVGVVEAARVVDGSRVRPGDVLLGLASDGLHTNGYSLARRVLVQQPGDLDRYEPELGCTRGEALLRPHRCYAHSLLRLAEELAGQVTAMAHITGGGIPGNLVRVLPDGCRAEVHVRWEVPAVFRLVARKGPVDDEEMFRVFNMGVGTVVAVRPEAADRAEEVLRSCGETVYRVGEVTQGPRGVSVVVGEAR
ncbi:MAG: phosphoribosylformylglycinamidine cyclo-ligase [Armatimonadetes bacterium]|nr:phosphoribosylformylglycinamidine cyclo-ligase [Armatimonadota bacterium]